MRNIFFKSSLMVVLMGIAMSDGLCQCDFSQTRRTSLIEEDNTYGLVSWSNPENADSSDNNWASVSAITLGDYSYLMKAKAFGFSLPESSTICGVELQLEKHATGFLQTVRDQKIQLLISDTLAGDNLAQNTVWPTSDVISVYGDSTVDWGLNLSSTQVNDSNFGVGISIDLSGLSVLPVARLDAISLTVYYSNSTVLPVSLLHFKGVVTDKAAILEWATATETNNDYFIVESSKDGGTWNFETQVLGAGNSVSPNHYSTSIPIQSDHYFRLTQVDFDGSFKQYNPIFLTLDNQFLNEAFILPSPMPNDFVLNANDIKSMKIYTMTGRLVKNLDVSGSETKLHFSDLPGGGYAAIVEYDQGKLNYQKFVKAR